MGKDKIVSIRMKEEDWKTLQKDAKQEERRVSNLLLFCWKRWRKTKKR